MVPFAVVMVPPLRRLLNVPLIGLAEVLLMTVNTVPGVSVVVPVSTNLKLTFVPIVTPSAFSFDASGVVARLTLHLTAEGGLKVTVLLMVSVPAVGPTPGCRLAPVRVPLPTVTAPLMVPVPLSVPEFTCTGPLPAADPVVFAAIRV